MVATDTSTIIASTLITPTVPSTSSAGVTSTLYGVASNAPVTLSAEAMQIYPTFDGATNKLSIYLENSTPGATGPIYPTQVNGTAYASWPPDPTTLSPADFESWNSAYQKEYLHDVGVSYGQGLVIGAALNGGSGPAIHVALSSNQDANGNAIPETQVKVIVMENLTKTSFATMTQADQTLVTGGTDAGLSTALAFSDGYNFATTLSPTLGLDSAATIAAKVQAQTNAGIANTGPNAILTPQQIIQNAIAGIISDAQQNGVPIDLDLTTYKPILVTDTTSTLNTTGSSLNSLLNNNDVTSTGTTVAAAEAAVSASNAAAQIAFGQQQAQYVVDTISYNLSLVGYIPGVGPAPVAPTPPTPPTLQSTNLSANVTAVNNVLGNGRLLNYNDVSLFVSELQNELTQVNNMKVYSLTDITNAVSAIQSRYKDVSAFGSVANQVAASNLNAVNIAQSNTGLHDNNNSFNDANYLTYNVVDTDNTLNTSLTNTATEQVWAVTDSNATKANNNGTDYLSTSQDGSNIITIPNEVVGRIGNYNSNAGGYDTVTDGYTAGTNQSTTASGYEKLINAETQILGLQNQMNVIASTGVLANKSLDVPDLIFYLQLYTNLTDEQENAAATEVVNQQNDLLNAYSQMQQIINTVQSKFDPKSTNQQLYINGDDSDKISSDSISEMATDSNALTSAQLAIISMFDLNAGKGSQNPIEKLFNITRPTFNFFNDATNSASITGKYYTSTSYNAYGTSLSDAVTQINQQTQIMMNNINDLDKEKNEHFDLANNALSKASDILQAIGNNLNG